MFLKQIIKLGNFFAKCLKSAGFSDLLQYLSNRNFMLELEHRKKCNMFTDYTKFKQNEPPYELHHMSVMIAYSQNIADQYSLCFKKYHLSSNLGLNQ